MECRLAKSSDIDQIIQIFKISFGETDETLKIFFEEKFQLDKCVVCIVNERIVALLNMFNTKIVTNNHFEKAVYIYGAATHPEYRKKGYMSSLISYSHKLAYNRGYKYSILLPASRTLYDYYKKFGYIDFFKVRFININSDEIRKYITTDNFNDYKPLSLDYISDLRFNICKDHIGTAMWNIKDIEYAINMNHKYGGEIVYSNEGYALCYVANNNVLQVIEFMVTENDFNNLLTAIYRRYPNINYRFRLPVFTNYFSEEGEINTFGMLKPLNNDINCDIINKSSYPYLGLTLD